MADSVGPAASNAVPILERDLASGNEIDQAKTAYTIFRIAPERAAEMVSKLTDLLNSTNLISQLMAATYLGAMGSDARPAIPFLKARIGRLNARGTSGSSLRDGFIDAVMRIDKSELNSEVPHWVAALTDPNPEIRREATHLLMKLGPDSRSALPELRKHSDERPTSTQPPHCDPSSFPNR